MLRCTGREKTARQPAGRLGQVNCFKGHHRHWRTFACCIVPLDEHCLITHTVNDIPVVPWLLHAGPPVAASTRAPALAWTTPQEKRLPGVWDPNTHPSPFAWRLFIAGTGSTSAAALFARLGSPHGQKALPNLGSSTWQNNVLQLLRIQTRPLGFPFNRPEPRLDFQNLIPSRFHVIPPKW